MRNLESFDIYLRRVLICRSKQLFSMFLLISLVILISYAPNLSFGKGPILYNTEGMYENVWFIDLNQNYKLDYPDLIILNPQLYLNTLKPLNEGKEVFYFLLHGDSVLPYIKPGGGCFLYLDLIEVFNFKLAFTQLLITTFILIFTIYLFIKRKNFQFIRNF